MRAVIFDIDGTLADVTHRLHHLENPELERNQQWNAFFGDQHLDPVIEPIAWLARALWHHGNQVWPALHEADRPEFPFTTLIVSARPDDYYKQTITWLDEGNIPYQALYMRKAGDTRPDPIVKAEILEQILEDGYEPFLVVDDRPQVVAMWRSFGLTCLQCAPDEKPLSKYAGQAILSLLVGPSGAGKSTFAEKNYGRHSIVSTDQLREDNGWGHHPDDLKRTWELAHGLVEARIKVGVPTILDATNIKRKDRLNVLRLVPKGQLVNYVVIDRDLGDKIKARGWRPEELVLKHHRTFQANLKDILAGDNQPNVIVHDKRIR
jgi:predicted kinase